MNNDHDLIRGGQGRTEREIVQGAALMVAVLIAVVVVALVLAIICP